MTYPPNPTQPRLGRIWGIADLRFYPPKSGFAVKSGTFGKSLVVGVAR